MSKTDPRSLSNLGGLKLLAGQLRPGDSRLFVETECAGLRQLTHDEWLQILEELRVAPGVLPEVTLSRPPDAPYWTARQNP